MSEHLRKLTVPYWGRGDEIHRSRKFLMLQDVNDESNGIIDVDP